MTTIVASHSSHILNDTISIVSRHWKKKKKRLDSVALCVHGGNEKLLFHRLTLKIKRKLVLLDQRLPSGSLIPEPQCVWSAQVNLLWPGDDTTAGPAGRLEKLTPLSIVIFNSSRLYIVRKHISSCKSWQGEKRYWIMDDIFSKYLGIEQSFRELTPTYQGYCTMSIIDNFH